MAKKLLAMILTLVMIAVSVPVTVGAAADGTTVTNAVSISRGTTYTKSWTKSTDHLNHYVKFSVPEKGIITIKATKPYDSEGEYARIGFTLYNANSTSTPIWDAEGYYSVDDASTSYVYRVGLAAGTYYMTLEPHFYVTSGIITTKYSVSFAANAYCEVEPNGTAAKATPLTLSKIHTGYFGHDGGDYDENDYYKFTVKKGDTYRVTWYGAVDNTKEIFDTTVLVNYISPSNEDDSLTYDFERNFDSNGNGFYEFTADKSGTAYIRVYNYHQAQLGYRFAVSNRYCSAHGHTNSSTVVAPTCTAQGYTKTTCSRCGFVGQTNVKAALGHSYKNVVTAPTCTAQGYTTRTCTRCKVTVKDTYKAALGHSYKKTVVAPTCTAQGYTTNTCTRCKHSYKDATTAALGHSYGAYTTVAPTCEDQGYDGRTCSRCKTVDKKNITAALGHTYSGADDLFCDVCDDINHEINYPDVRPKDWYHEAAAYCSYFGYMKGYSNGKFGPADNLKRQDFVVALARIAGADLTPYLFETGNLKDVALGSYYAPAVAWAVDNGIIKGYNDGRFGVNNPITREQVCTILYRYAGEPEVANVNNTLLPFPDKFSISTFSRTAVAWAVDNGVISGMGNTGKIAPVARASRAQVATIIMRMDKAGLF